MSRTTWGSIPAAAVIATLALTLGACSPSPSNAEATERSADDLSPELITTCQNVFAREHASAAENIVVVIDATASNATASLPPDLIQVITQASLDDSSLTMIAVEGQGAARFVAQDVALSTEGTRGRPSVQRLAEIMPTCVEQVLRPLASPQTAGSDLYTALALAAEVAPEGGPIWLISDFLSTSGPVALTSEALLADPIQVAQASASASPLNLGGRALKVAGLGATNASLVTANRDWLVQYAQTLCTSWGAASCGEIEASPVNAAAPTQGLPEDPVPSFPQVTTVTTTTSQGLICEFVVPAVLLFGADSAEFNNETATALQEPLAALVSSPTATATIKGHTASVPGTAAADLVEFSARRAEAVGSWFGSQGIDGSRLGVVGVGDSEPLAEDLDPITGAQNAAAAAERRVTIQVAGVTSC